MKKLLAASAVAAFAVLGLAAPAQAAPPEAAAQNSTAYWEALGYGDCTKVELADGVSSYTLAELEFPHEYTLLVLKAGSGATANQLVEYPVAGEAYAQANGKDLSHVIYCVGVKRS